MSDRLCIKNKNDQRRISPEDLMECCRGCGYGCNGGFLYQSWSYWKVTGIVTGEGYGDKNSCKPYAFPSCNHHSSGPRDDCSDHHYSTPSCKQECSNQDYTKDYQDDKIKSTKAYSVRGEKNMMNELVNHGPFEVALNVYSDFLVYKNGVYKHQHGRFLGGHAIRIIGYG
jgi:cathepsin B